MLDKEFVTYKVAEELQKIKFDCSCIAIYSVNNRELHHYDMELTRKEMSHGVILAPLWQQVITWFLDKHNLDVYPHPVFKNRIFYTITRLTDKGPEKVVGSPYEPGMHSEVYYDAIEKAILHAIKIVKNEHT